MAELVKQAASSRRSPWYILGTSFVSLLLGLVPVAGASLAVAAFLVVRQGGHLG